MDRHQAIQAAQYFRIGASVIDVSTNEETTFSTDCVSSAMHTESGKYKRMVTHRPSIAAAKRYTRGKKGVVAQRKGEDFRKLSATWKAQRDELARLKAVEAARIRAERDLFEANMLQAATDQAKALGLGSREDLDDAEFAPEVE